MMMTCLSFAVISSSRRGRPRSGGSAAVRYSIAKWIRSSSRPGTGRSRGAVDAAGQDDRVEVAPELVDRHVAPDVSAGPEFDAFLAQQRRAGDRGRASPS